MVNLYSNLKEELLKAIIEDEKEYCFDRTYCSDESWVIQHPNETREQAFNKAIQDFSNMSVEDVIGFFGDKYDYLLENYDANEKRK